MPLITAGLSSLFSLLLSFSVPLITGCSPGTSVISVTSVSSGSGASEISVTGGVQASSLSVSGLPKKSRMGFPRKKPINPIKITIIIKLIF